MWNKSSVQKTEVKSLHLREMTRKLLKRYEGKSSLTYSFMSLGIGLFFLTGVGEGKKKGGESLRPNQLISLYMCFRSKLLCRNDDHSGWH